MADQDFNIKVVTTADTAGIRQTEVELSKLQRQQAMFAETARRQAAAVAAAPPPAPVVAGGAVGLSGAATAIGTVVAALGYLFKASRDFEEQMNRQTEAMMKATERSHELGLAVADTLDKLRNVERIDTEPLEQSFQRLTGDVRRLKTEMQIAFEAGAYEDVKKLNGELGFTKGLLDRVNAGLERQAATAEKARQKQVQGQEDAYGAASPQAKAILENEKAARAAEARGDQIGAARFQKSADLFRKFATPADLKSLEAVTKSYGEAAPELSDVEKNLKAFNDYFGGGGGVEKNTNRNPGSLSEARAAGEIGHGAQLSREAEIEATRKASQKAQQDREESNKRLKDQQGGRDATTVAIERLEAKFDRYWS